MILTTSYEAGWAKIVTLGGFLFLITDGSGRFTDVSVKLGESPGGSWSVCVARGAREPVLATWRRVHPHLHKPTE